MIEIKNLNKTFHLKSGDVVALKDVSLSVKDGEKYGVIGYSGAGKSTLVRCINFLETPDDGEIDIEFFGSIKAEGGVLSDSNGKKVTDKDLNKLRKGIGMIFQHFNLLDRSTVFDNIAYPLKGTSMTKAEIESRVFELLDTVDLREKADVYPSQLSGGQKQRVAIARALANNPRILLSDEATSALDPDATESILNLLKKLNEELGLTIIIITHEMSVIKNVCERVAVMEDGNIVEEGKVIDVFSNPKAPITRKFVSSASSLSKIDTLIKEDSPLIKVKGGERLVRLSFGDSVSSPVITEIIKTFGVEVNIVLANVEVIGKDTIGEMVLRLGGKEEDVESAITFMERNNVRVEELNG